MTTHFRVWACAGDEDEHWTRGLDLARVVTEMKVKLGDLSEPDLLVYGPKFVKIEVTRLSFRPNVNPTVGFRTTRSEVFIFYVYCSYSRQ